MATMVVDRVCDYERRVFGIPVSAGRCGAELLLPADPAALVVVLHGSGSGKDSPRNQELAGTLAGRGYAVLLFDFLTDEERAEDNQTAGFRFDLPFLIRRAGEVLEWVRSGQDAGGLPVVLFGGSTGAAVGLAVASGIAPGIRAVVSRGGRSDLVSDVLSSVCIPVLFVVGEHDDLCRHAAESAVDSVVGPGRLVVVRGASHLFEEPGAMPAVERATLDFLREVLPVAGDERGTRMFSDREEAGRWLSVRLLNYRDDPLAVVMALPRGGVPVAVRVARALRLPWDVWVVRKVGAPDNPELAIGAVASGGIAVKNKDILAWLGITDSQFERLADIERHEVVRRERLWALATPRRDLHGRWVLLVDDGIATGATALAAVSALRLAGASKVVVAAPVASVEARKRLEDAGIETVVVEVPECFGAVGNWYRDFNAVGEEEVSAWVHAELFRQSREAVLERSQLADGSRNQGVL